MQMIADRAFYLRGKAIGAYAQIEFQLADLCWKAWAMPAYVHLAKPFPFKATTRVEEVAKIFSVDGPLAQYWNEVEPLLAQLVTFEGERHLFAHGHLILTESDVHFRLFVPNNKTNFDLRTENWTLDQMVATTNNVSEYARQFGLLLDKIHREQSL